MEHLVLLLDYSLQPGGMIGSVIPILETGFGSLVGSLIGLLVSIKLVEPALVYELQKKMNKDLEICADLNIYEKSLIKFNVTSDTSVPAIKQMRRAYNLMYHPDKNRSDRSVLDESSDKFIEMEMHYRIIEEPRKAHNKWE